MWPQLVAALGSLLFKRGATAIAGRFAAGEAAAVGAGRVAAGEVAAGAAARTAAAAAGPSVLGTALKVGGIGAAAGAAYGLKQVYDGVSNVIDTVSQLRQAPLTALTGLFGSAAENPGTTALALGAASYAADSLLPEGIAETASNILWYATLAFAAVWASQKITGNNLLSAFTSAATGEDAAPAAAPTALRLGAPAPAM